MVSLQAIGSVIRSWPRLDLVYSFLWSLLALFIPLIIHPSLSLSLSHQHQYHTQSVQSTHHSDGV